jgi:multiple sugar transport system permease protein
MARSERAPARRSRPHRLITFRQERALYVWFLLPLVLLLIGLTLYPIATSIYTSFTNLNLARPRAPVLFVGFQHYQTMFASEIFWITLRNTVVMVIGAVGLQFALGFAIALLLDRELPGVGAVRTLLLLPLMVTPVVGALVWALMLNPSTGVITYFLQQLGWQNPPVWLGSGPMAMTSIIVVDAWQWTPFVMLLMLAGLQGIPKEHYEAADLDGASFLQRVRFIILPALKPLIGVVLLLRVMDAFKIFDKIYILTAGGPGSATETVAFHAYRQGFGFFRMGYASAISMVLLVVVLVVSVILIRQTQTESEHA